MRGVSGKVTAFLGYEAEFDIDALRSEFPILLEKVHGKPLTYLDSAATTQKPLSVIEAVSRFYLKENANIHRGVHALSERATASYENARLKVKDFINAGHASEIVFTRGVTEAINLVAKTHVKKRVGPGDEILITEMEHHSNIVPWRMLSEETGAILRVAPINDKGEIILEEFEKSIGSRTKFISVTHVSNVLGTINPVREIAEMARVKGVPVMVDGAQAAPHLPIDVRETGCDFYAFSAHKAYGPTGVGVLYGRLELLEEMPPYQGGGDMILSVDVDETVYAKPPHKFEAGTQNLAGVAGLAAAIDFLKKTRTDAMVEREAEVAAYATATLEKIPGLSIVGTAENKVGVISFTLEGIHPHDIGTILDKEGIAIRAGHHCAQPLMRRFGIAGTARASFGCYNDSRDVDVLAEGLGKVKKVFA